MAGGGGRDDGPGGGGGGGGGGGPQPGGGGGGGRDDISCWPGADRDEPQTERKLPSSFADRAEAGCCAFVKQAISAGSTANFACC